MTEDNSFDSSFTADPAARKWLESIFEARENGTIDLKQPYRDIIDTIRNVSQASQARGEQVPELMMFNDAGKCAPFADYDDLHLLAITAGLHDLRACILNSVTTTGPLRYEDVPLMKGFLETFGVPTASVLSGLKEYNPNDEQDPARGRRVEQRWRGMYDKDVPEWQKRHRLPEISSKKPGDPLNRTYTQYWSDKCSEAERTGKKYTIVNTTGPETLNSLSPSEKHVGKVVIQGGVRYVDGSVVPDEEARNMCYHIPRAKELLTRLNDEKIPTEVFTKNVAFACSLDPGFFRALKSTGHKGMGTLDSMHRCVDAKQLDDTMTNINFFPKLTPEKWLSLKTDLTKSEISATLDQLGEHATNDANSTSDSNYYEYKSKFGKAGAKPGLHTKAVTYDPSVLPALVSPAVAEALNLYTNYVPDEDPELEKNTKKFGKSPANLGVNAENVKNAMIALSGHGTLATLDEASKKSLWHRLTYGDGEDSASLYAEIEPTEMTNVPEGWELTTDASEFGRSE